MQFTRLLRVGFAAAVIPLLALSCASSEPKSDFELDIDSDQKSAFTQEDRQFLEGVAAKLAIYFADALETQPGGM